METVQSYIEGQVSRKKAGEVIFPTDFRGAGTEAAIKKALSRMVQKGPLKRLAHGIYYIPKIDPLLGEIRPGAHEVATMLARKEKVRIRPSGASALNALGLSTQVPTRMVYITDGPPRKIKLGKLVIQFKATSHKKLATTGKISSLVIQALEELDLKHIAGKEEERIKELLLKEKPKDLKHDLSIASARINDYIIKLLKPRKDDGLVTVNG
jgi:Family of unknown function (DUF6088)